MTEIGDQRLKRLAAKVFRLLSRPRPTYELFIDADGMTPWFAMVAFPTRREWDAYKLIAVLRRFLLDLAGIARRLDREDLRFALLMTRMVTLLDIAAQTEPLEGEVRDGRLHDD